MGEYVLQVCPPYASVVKLIRQLGAQGSGLDALHCAVASTGVSGGACIQYENDPSAASRWLERWLKWGGGGWGERSILFLIKTTEEKPHCHTLGHGPKSTALTAPPCDS